MKMHPIIVTTVLLAGLLGFSQAVSATGFKDRQHQQNRRIQRGIVSGQITPREAKHLYRDQRQIRQLQRHFLADGNLSRRERNTLKERLDRSSNRIYRYKHNHRRIKPLKNYDGSRRHFARR